MKKIISVFIAFLLVLQIVSAWGLTHPQPGNLQLLRGEEARFWVTIDAVQSKNDMVCKLQMISDSEVEFLFDVQEESSEIIIPKGTAKALYGTVSSNDAASYKMHSFQFCPDCKEIVTQEEGVTGVQGKYCVPFNVEVADSRTRENPQEQIPPKPVDYFWYYVAGISITLIVLIAILFFLVRKLDHQKSVTLKKSKAKPKKKR
ncbi:hypothetical protein J4418_02920 [Candidatus Woesearchaeota archaeon]|nr:hypothetical protein [Candidatus Woesearchaeota archaeon]